jgi:hypothetical protein
MKRSIIRGLATIAVCAVVLGAWANTKNPVTRPYRIHASATWIVNGDGSASVYQTGECTHFGRITIEGLGSWDLENFAITSASGTATAVNGDEVSWILPGSTYQCEFIGAKGRGLSVTGGFNTVWQSDPVIRPGPTEGAISITLSYIGEGTITY